MLGALLSAGPVKCTPLRPGTHRRAVTIKAARGIQPTVAIESQQPAQRPHKAMDPVSMAIIGGLAVTALVALLRFITADADLALLMKGGAPKNAFRGKVVWITGASQGLGEALAQHLAARGARLILSSRSAPKLQKVKDGLEGPHASEALVLPVNLCGHFEDMQRAAAAADAAFGGAGIDYIIHNAGASQHALAAETSPSVTDTMFALNTLGPIKLTRAALPLLLARRKGRVVVVASMAAKVPAPGEAVYASCKAALWGYFGSLAAEIADSGVGVTLCCPGPIGTGTEDAPRIIYGAEGLQQQHAPRSKKGRLVPARCAELVAVAAAHGVPEAWLSKHPVLLMGYLMQYAPALGWAIMRVVGPKRAHGMHHGSSGYDAAGLLFGAKAAAQNQHGG